MDNETNKSMTYIADWTSSLIHPDVLLGAWYYVHMEILLWFCLIISARDTDPETQSKSMILDYLEVLI